MNLKTVLTPETVNLHLKGTTKEEIIDEMLEVLIAAGKVSDKTAARECVLDRERKMSTGMKHGIAIPHGKTDTVSDLVACIGISDNPVDFDSLDQEPCRIFIMTLSPVNKTVSILLALNFFASVPKISSASYPSISTLFMFIASNTSFIIGI